MDSFDLGGGADSKVKAALTSKNSKDAYGQGVGARYGSLGAKGRKLKKRVEEDDYLEVYVDKEY